MNRLLNAKLARQSLLQNGVTAIALCGLFLISTSANAQQPWEYDPYRVRIWMAAGDVPELPPRVQREVLRSIAWQAEVAEASAWRIEAQPAPERLRHDLLHRMDELTVDQLRNSDLVVFARPLFIPATTAGVEPTTVVIDQLEHLTHEKMRVGICHPLATRLGRATKAALESNNLWTKTQPNVQSIQTTGLPLVKMVLNGELDAAVVHRFHAERVFASSSFLSSSMLSGFLEDYYIYPVTTPDDSATVLAGDKLVLLAIDFVDGMFRVKAREMNCRTQSWSHVADRYAGQIESIPETALDAVKDVFTPVVRIDDVVSGDERLMFHTSLKFAPDLEKGSFPAELEGQFQQQGSTFSTSIHVTKAANDENQWGIKDIGNGRDFVLRIESGRLAVYQRVDGLFAHARLRAGGLIRDRESPAELPEQAILRPIIRQNDRLGRIAPGGISEVPWTYMTTDVRRGTKLTCAVYSSFYNSIRGRGGRRTERMAVLVRPKFSSTELQLQTQDAEARPLAGYEVYSRLPDSESSKFLGRTDWRGKLLVQRDDAPLHILYLRSAGRLIARLPTVPGFETVQVAAMPNDEDRLWAQTLLQGLTVEFFDRVAEREMLAAVIRMKIKDGRFDQAQALIQRLEAPEFSRTHFYLMLTRVESDLKEYIPRENRRMLDQINEELTSIRTSLGTRFDPGLPRVLAKELEDAKGFGT